MKNILATLLLICTITFSFAQRDNISRTGETDPTPLFNDLIMPDAGGIFRGHRFDESYSDVYNEELDRSTVTLYDDESKDEFTVTSDMGEDFLNFADITYTFDELGLYHIKVNTYATSKQINDQVYDMVESYYTKKLGKGTMADDDYLEFEGKVKGNNYTVAMQKIEVEGAEGIYIYVYLSEED